MGSRIAALRIAAEVPTAAIAEKRETRTYIEDLLKHDEAVKRAVIEALKDNLAAFAQVVALARDYRY